MNCSDCKERKEQSVPYIFYESAMARSERTIKRLWILLILLVVMLVGTNAGWLWYESQFEEVVTTIQAEQETEEGNNYAVVGDIIGEAKSKDYDSPQNP